MQAVLGIVIIVAASIFVLVLLRRSRAKLSLRLSDFENRADRLRDQAIADGVTESDDSDAITPIIVAPVYSVFTPAAVHMPVYTRPRRKKGLTPEEDELREELQRLRETDEMLASMQLVVAALPVLAVIVVLIVASIG